MQTLMNVCCQFLKNIYSCLHIAGCSPSNINANMEARSSYMITEDWGAQSIHAKTHCWKEEGSLRSENSKYKLRVQFGYLILLAAALKISLLCFELFPKTILTNIDQIEFLSTLSSSYPTPNAHDPRTNWFTGSIHGYYYNMWWLKSF